MEIKFNKADLIVDLQYGSTGKGLIAGYMAVKNGYDTVITANMPNAGHTFIDADGNKMVHKVLPNGIVSPNCRSVLIGPGAVFSIDRLREEIKQANSFGYHFHTYIHPNAAVLRERHVKTERNSLSKISSTMQGSAAATVEKIMRNPDQDPTAWSVRGEVNDIDMHISVLNHESYSGEIANSDSILMEGAQGFSLGINERFYPYCTSRDCTPARFLADMGVPVTMLRKVIGTARVHPIRVGSTKDGYSGNFYSDQHETSWERLGVEPETTTVTGRIRRVFTPSLQQLRDAVFATQPHEVFLNFMNYDPAMGTLLVNSIDKMVNELTPHGGGVRYTGWGPTVNDVRERWITNPCDFTREQHIKGWVNE
jgi:adenylosuccinate synthase